jgi:hypothetical protein
MIIVQLTGGLGNQMFQYALARSLAERHQTTVKLDRLTFDTYTLRAFELSKFNIKADFAARLEVERFHTVNKLKKIVIVIRNILFNNKLRPVYEKKAFAFNPAILDLRGDIYFCGYWQSEKYFLTIEDIIRKEFSLKEPLSGKSVEIGDKIQGTSNTVSLHIRRGDYVTNPDARNFHGLCDPDYYRECISRLEKQLGKLHIFIFSDDIAWAKENLSFAHPMYFVDHNDAAHSYEDMYLMSLCEHNIIANSSFSWWGAWLNNNKFSRCRGD